MSNLFYDVCSFSISSIDDTKDEKKNQFILFQIDQIHKPVVAFCIEDVLPAECVMANVEIYDPNIIVDKIVDTSGLMVIRMIIGNDCLYLNSVSFGVINGNSIPLIKTKFNNYSYIEKTILDQVEEHEDKIAQLVKQVLKITKHLSG